MELEVELLSALKEYFNIPYCLMVLLGTEFLKLFLENTGKKYHFKFDKEERICFDLRVAIILISLAYGIAIVIIEQDVDLIFSLIVTFCMTCAFYEYFVKFFKKQFKNE